MSSAPSPDHAAPPHEATAAPLDLAQFDGFTPGPWTCGDPCGTMKGWQVQVVAGSQAPLHSVAILNSMTANQDAALIAAAPALLDECRRLRAENERQRATVERLRAALRVLAAGFAVASNQAGAVHPGLSDADNLHAVRAFCLENFHAARAALAGEVE